MLVNPRKHVCLSIYICAEAFIHPFTNSFIKWFAHLLTAIFRVLSLWLGPHWTYSGNLKRCPRQLLTFARHRARVQMKAYIFMSKYLNVIKPKQQTAKEHNPNNPEGWVWFWILSSSELCAGTQQHRESGPSPSLPFLALSRILRGLAHMCYSSHVSKLHACTPQITAPWSSFRPKGAHIVGKVWPKRLQVGSNGVPCTWFVIQEEGRVECGRLKGGPRVRALFAYFLMELAIWKGTTH